MNKHKVDGIKPQRIQKELKESIMDFRVIQLKQNTQKLKKT
jgi:hypothetical protein